MPNLVQIGRLALREEGQYWNAYYAMPNTMEGAIWIGSIPMIVVRLHDLRKTQFISLMKDVVGDIIEDRFGQRPEWPNPPQPAPESERAKE